MKNLKRWIVVLISCFLASCFCLTGCGDKSGSKNGKYDVTIKIKNNFDSQWIFTPDIAELRYEIDYTGKEMYFYVDSYNLPDHPNWGDKWFEPSFGGADVFDISMTYRAPEDKNKSYNGPVKEKGEYCICIEACATSDLWNYRYIYLHIIVI